jgi:transposase
VLVDIFMYMYSLLLGCMDLWVKNWLEEQRGKGEKCLEVKGFGDRYFVYRSTTYWDKGLHKKRKTSKYLGRLDRVHGLVLKGEKKLRVSSVFEYGNSLLLHYALDDLIPCIREHFPDEWMEIMALSIVRMTGGVPLKSVEDSWSLLYNRDCITPDLSPKNLSVVLKYVGADRRAQDQVFKRLNTNGRQLVYDLSCMYSKSQGVVYAEKGYNKDHIHVPQLNLALLCSLDENLPRMIRVIPGSVRDVKSLYKTVEEINVKDVILILDRGFFSMDLIGFLADNAYQYIVPARRNSKLYDIDIPLEGHFNYHEQLITCGKTRHEAYFLYMYEDQDLKLDERKNLYHRLDMGKMSREELEESLKTAGRILLLSNLMMSEKDLFELYKRRDSVEKMFRTYKDMLDADRLYLQDDRSVFGHVFISFLSLYGYCKLQNLLRDADLNTKLTPHDLLTIFKKVHIIETDNGTIISDTPKKVEQLEKKLNLNILPKNSKS